MVEQLCLSEALISSAKEIFSTMVFMDLTEATEPDLQSDDKSLLGSITFKGGIEGCLAIGCGASCAKAIAMNMLGIESADEVTEEGVCDAIGEIANMVMGGIKSRVLKSVNTLEVSIPSVVSGRDLKNNLGDKAMKISMKVSVDSKYPAELMLMYRESIK